MPVGRGGLTLRPFGEIHIARQVGPPLLPRLNGVEAVSSYPFIQERSLETPPFEEVGFPEVPLNEVRECSDATSVASILTFVSDVCCAS